MSRYNPDLNTLFIHVPRCAGTSMIKKDFVGGTTHDSVMSFAGQHWFDDAWKWAFVRNPWDRYVSAVFHVSALPKFMRLEYQPNDRKGAFVQSIRQLHARINNHGWHNIPHRFRPQHDYVCDSDSLMVDFLGRYETLLDDWNYICDTLGVADKELTHIAKSGRDGRPLDEFYNEETFNLLGEIYEKDVSLFGYR